MLVMLTYLEGDYLLYLFLEMRMARNGKVTGPSNRDAREAVDVGNVGRGNP